MFPKKHRLAKIKDIQTIFARGRSFFCPWFTLKFVPKPTTRRFTVVVSTKVSKKAVARNGIKRVLRETLRQHLQEFPFGDYMLIVKPKTATLENTKLRQEAEQFLQTTRLFPRK